MHTSTSTNTSSSSKTNPSMNAGMRGYYGLSYIHASSPPGLAQCRVVSLLLTSRCRRGYLKRKRSELLVLPCRSLESHGLLTKWTRDYLLSGGLADCVGLCCCGLSFPRGISAKCIFVPCPWPLSRRGPSSLSRAMCRRSLAARRHARRLRSPFCMYCHTCLVNVANGLQRRWHGRCFCCSKYMIWGWG